VRPFCCSCVNIVMKKCKNKKTFLKCGKFPVRVALVAFFVNWVLNCGCDPCKINGPDDAKFHDIYYDALPLGGNSPEIYGVNFDSTGFSRIVENGNLFSEPNNDGMMAFFRSEAGGSNALLYKNLNYSKENPIVDESTFPGISFVVAAPNSNKILFADGKDLNFFTFEGTGDVQLTSGFCTGTLPSFSPDGNYFAFYIGNKTDSALQLLVYNTNDPTGGPVMKTDLVNGVNSQRVNLEIGWTPDSKSVVFSAYSSSISNNMVVKVISNGSETVVSDDNFGAVLPIISPGLDSVCFACADGNIRIKNIGNGKLWKLTDAGPDEYYSFPRWSPDGEKIMFIRYPRKTVSEFRGTLEVFNLKSGARTILGNNISRAFWNR
jgi:Tol biopolymer transport system component